MRLSLVHIMGPCNYMPRCYRLDGYTLQVPSSCCRSCLLFASTFSVTCKHRSQPVNKQFAWPFSLHRTFKRLIPPSSGFRGLHQYSKPFPRPFVTFVHAHALPSSRDADTIAENWSLTEQRFRHLERKVLGKYLHVIPTPLGSAWIETTLHKVYSLLSLELRLHIR